MRGAARRAAAWAALGLRLAAGADLAALPSAAAAGPAAPDPGAGWRAEFDEVCGRTQDAMAIPSDELRRLVARADALLPRLAALEPTQRRVHERRLQACRNLYQFVLDTREGG